MSAATSPDWPEPSARVADVLARAQLTEPDVHNAAVLATVDGRGRPSARVVLIKDVSPEGYVFYTNYLSRKGRELAENPYATLCAHFKTLGEQLRIEGRCERLSPEDSDAYFNSRPRGSRLGAIASQQSEPIASRAALQARYDELAARYEEQQPPRPEHWGGYRLIADRVEFWHHRDSRLHHRELYLLSSDVWTRSLLQP